MAVAKKAAPAKSTAAKKSSSAAKASTGSAWNDGYEGVDWELYERVRPHQRHSGATGAGLVEYTLWFEITHMRSAADRKDVPLPGQPVR